MLIERVDEAQHQAENRVNAVNDEKLGKEDEEDGMNFITHLPPGQWPNYSFENKILFAAMLGLW